MPANLSKMLKPTNDHRRMYLDTVGESNDLVTVVERPNSSDERLQLVAWNQIMARFLVSTLFNRVFHNERFRALSGQGDIDRIVTMNNV